VETEIKLRVHGADLPAVTRAVERLAVPESLPVTRRLESRYYDTPERCLVRNRVALRVRRTERGFVQTIKTEGAAGLCARGEWEIPVPSFMPRLEGAAHRLTEQFVTVVERRQMEARYPVGASRGSRIEVAVDTGEIRAGDRCESVCELELELIEGEAADLFDLGARLAEQVPLQLSLDSKSARGSRLAAGEPPAAVKAEKLEFPPEVTLEEGMRDSLRGCVRQWFANQAAAFDGRDIEGVHQMRVALRRLRSALHFFRDFIPDPPLDEFRDRSKWVANSLGPARDWDVFLTETLPPIQRLWPEHPGLRALQEAAIRARRDGYVEARVAMASPDYTVFALRLSGWIERGGWRAGLHGETLEALGRPMTEHAARLLDRLRDKALEAGRGFDDLDPEDKHRLRIALKKLRYAAEFFRGLYPRKDVKKFRDALTDLLDLLGRLNDLTVARGLCGRLLDAADDPAAMRSGVAALLDWHEQQGQVSDRTLSKAWGEFRAAEPFWGAD
jgi:triphosphatase